MKQHPKRIIISTAQSVWARYSDTPLDLDGLERLRARLGDRVSIAELIRRAVQQYTAKHGEHPQCSDDTTSQLEWAERRKKDQAEVISHHRGPGG